jgi:predicted TPR repeat methyltransferase
MVRATAAAELRLAEKLLKEGRPGEAADICRRVLARKPSDLRAQHLLGRVLISQGKLELATLSLQALLLQQPRSVEALATLANAQRLTGDLDSALETVDRALAIDSQSTTARVERANLLLDRGEVAAALAEAERAWSAAPRDSDATLTLARVLLAAGRNHRAREVFAGGIRLDPRLRTRHQAIANWFTIVGRPDQAQQMLEEGLALQPGDPELEHLVAAAGYDTNLERASDAYVKRYFDQFADQFDRRLRELQYRVPEMLVAKLADKASDRSGALDVLDAGCGTGLAAPLLRPLAERLVGVDLSAGMLRRAADLGIYDELHEAELTSFLASVVQRFDAVLAADVFIYFGELRPIVAAMAAALRPAGVLAVSIELAPSEDRVLQPSGRWAHPISELQSAAASAGLDLELDEADLRYEYGRPIRGVLAVGRRTAS